MARRSEPSPAARVRAAVAAALAGPCGLASGTPLLAAVSGGLDSVALAHTLAALGWPATLAHVHHHLRGEAADADAAFVEALAARLGCPFVRLDAPLRGDGNRQDEARRLRYAALAEAAAARGLAAVATAHTASDQAETLLLHLVRGTGAQGLAGMPPARVLAPGVALVRPLLGLGRSALAEAARAEGWDWREDASNASAAYRRNRLRHDVLPLLEAEGGPGVAERIARAAEAVRGLLAALEASSPDADAARLPLADVEGLPPAARRARLAAALAAQGLARRRADVARLEALLDAQPGRRAVLAGAVVWREREGLRFVLGPPGARLPGDARWPVAVPGRTDTPAGVLEAELLEAAPDAGRDPRVVVVDAAALARPLVLRPWRDGDRVRPLGAPGSRLVSDVLTDARVPSSVRRDVPVLEAGGAILWLVGVRLAEAARLRTKTAVRLRWTPARPPEGA
ncbi:MAG: tRNA lysidine(34) synthetase TilS [Rubricoccaceae bacterium]